MTAKSPVEFPLEPKKMPITDLFSALEKAVEDAKDKQSKLDIANAASQVAQENYSKSLALVDKLKNELTQSIGDIFPNPRIRVAS